MNNIEFSKRIDESQSEKEKIVTEYKNKIGSLEIEIRNSGVKVTNEKVEAKEKTQTITSMKEGVHYEISDGKFVLLVDANKLQQVKKLNLKRKGISDISALGGLTNLVDLSLSDNNISDISVLEGLKNLESLGFLYNNISDISVLQGLTKLNALFMGGNKITDISALKDLQNLKSLHMRRNNISDVTPLEGLKNLMYLDFLENNVADITPLGGLKKLSELNISKQGIPMLQKETHKDQLNNILPKLVNLKRLILEGSLKNEPISNQLNLLYPDLEITYF